MFKSFNRGRVNILQEADRLPVYRNLSPPEAFYEELKLELYLHRDYSSQELLEKFTATNGKSPRPAARLAIAKLLFGLDKTVEDAERRLGEGITTRR